MPRPSSERKRKPVEPPGPVEPDAPFKVSLSGGDETLDVTLSIPESHEECSITMEPMGARLDFLPANVTFSLANPRHTKMTMPCNHAFGAMSLTYHMARNSMRCPVCRQGLDNPLNHASIPFHFRAELVSKTRRETEIEEQENFEEFQRSQEAEFEQGLLLWRDAVISPADGVPLNHITLLVCGNEIEGDNSRAPPLLVNEFPLDISLNDRGAFIFSLSSILEPHEIDLPGLADRARVRALTRNLRATPNVSEFFLAVSIRGPNDEILRLDESPYFDLTPGDPPRMLLIARSQTSNFELTVLSGDQPRQIESLSWHVLAADLARMITRESYPPDSTGGLVAVTTISL